MKQTSNIWHSVVFFSSDMLDRCFNVNSCLNAAEASLRPMRPSCGCELFVQVWVEEASSDVSSCSSSGWLGPCCLRALAEKLLCRTRPETEVIYLPGLRQADIFTLMSSESPLKRNWRARDKPQPVFICIFYLNFFFFMEVKAESISKSYFAFCRISK